MTSSAVDSSDTAVTRAGSNRSCVRLTGRINAVGAIGKTRHIVRTREHHLLVGHKDFHLLSLSRKVVFISIHLGGERDLIRRAILKLRPLALQFFRDAFDLGKQKRPGYGRVIVRITRFDEFGEPREIRTEES